MKICKFLTLLAVLFLTGCGTLEIGIERKPINTTTVNVVPTEAPNPTAPLEQLSLQPSPQPSPTPADIPPTDASFLPKATLDAPPPTPGQQSVNITIYLIAIDDNGQTGELVGCGDSVIPVQVETTPTKEILKASLESLLTMKDQYYGESGLYNALYQSDLQLESITLENGKAEIYLMGTMMLGGVCDNPRVKAQLEATALQFSTVQEVSIFINGKPLDEVLSLQG